MIEIGIDEIFQLSQRKLDTQFQFTKTLSRGSFGTVNLYYDKLNQQEVAIKIICKDYGNENIITQFKEEINLLKKVSHQNIVSLYDFFETTDNAYMVMEYIKGGTLAQLMTLKNQTLNEEDIRTIIKYLLIAVSHLHKIGICHRDIKLENIMFNSFDDLSSLKVIDFGLSTDLCDLPSKLAGTVLYMPPERLLKQKYTNRIDVWSIGILTYILFHKGKHPFISHNDANVNNKDDYLQRILHNAIKTILSKSDASFFAQDFIQKLIEIKPSIRYSVKYALNHPWLTKDYSKMYSHILESDIKVFKQKQIEMFTAMLFLSQYRINKRNKAIDSTPVSQDVNPSLSIFNPSKRRLRSYGRKKQIKLGIETTIKPLDKSSLAVCTLSSFYNKPSSADKDNNTTKSSNDIQQEAYNPNVTETSIKFKVVIPKKGHLPPMLSDNISLMTPIPIGRKRITSFTLSNKTNISIKAIHSKFKKVEKVNTNINSNSNSNTNTILIQTKGKKKTLVLPRITSLNKKHKQY